MLTMKDMTFCYTDTAILENITLSVDEPKIIGLWGRNGVGKTTLMHLIAGNYRPQHGSINVFEADPYMSLASRNHLCFIQETHPLNPQWKMKHVFKFAKTYYPNWDEALAQRLLHLFDLPPKKYIQAYSTGMRTALQLIIGTASNTDILILDEPTNGLDAVVRKQYYDILLEQYEINPRTIILSTHHINEVLPICEDLIVLHDKKILHNESVDTIRTRGAWLIGDKSTIEPLLPPLSVLETKTLGPTIQVMVDMLYQDAHNQLTSPNVTVKPVDTTDYLVAIIAAKGGDHNER